MMKFENIITDRKAKIADLVVLILCILFLALMIILDKVPATMDHILALIMLMWLNWIYSKYLHLARCIRKIDSFVMDELKEKKSELPTSHKTWSFYAKKIRGILILKCLFVIFAFLILFKLHSRDFFLLIAFVGFLGFKFMWATAYRMFMADIIDTYNAEPEIRINNLKSYGLARLLLVGFVAGLPFVLLVYNILDLTSLQYFLYYFAFSGLVSFSMLMLTMYRYFTMIMRSVDSVRTGTEPQE